MAETFTANSISSSDGFLGVLIRESIESGQTKTAYIVSVYSKTKFKVEVTPVSRSQSGLSKADYLNKVKEGMPPLEENVHSEFMAKNDIGLNVSTTGTARVKMVYEGKVDVSAKDSNQYDEKAGKEMVPVHYKV